MTFSKAQSESFIANFPVSEVFRSLFDRAYKTESDKISVSALLQECATIGVHGVTIRSDNYSHEYVKAIHSRGLKVAVVIYKINSLVETVNFIEHGVEELWLDDITNNVTPFDPNNIGVISLPKEKHGNVDYRIESQQAQIVWSSLPGKSYKIERSQDLMHWQLIVNEITASSTTFSSSYTDQNIFADKMFYRVTPVTR